MRTLTNLFNLGMMRNYGEVLQDASGTVLNLGAGKKLIPGSIPIEYPEWDAESMHLPWDDNSVDMIHAYHFLEHITNVPFVISEMNRVLKPGAHANIVVPYYKSAMQWQDLDHKSAFTEKTFNHLFNSDYYEKGKCKPMEIVTNFIMGDCEANLCLVIQLRKIK